MKKTLNLQSMKAYIKYAIYVVSVITACYGFWGSLFPDLTLVEGTYRFVVDETHDRAEYDAGADEIYADILDGKVNVTFRSKFFEIFKNKRGFEK